VGEQDREEHDIEASCMAPVEDVGVDEPDAWVLAEVLGSNRQHLGSGSTAVTSVA
jgi:hypothetical protein